MAVDDEPVGCFGSLLCIIKISYKFLGYNYRITDIQAALGISQLNRLNMFLQKRRGFAEIYNQAFKDFEGLIIPNQIEGNISGWHLYVIQLELEKLKIGRKEIFEELQKRGIGVNVHYIPVYYHPYYSKLGYQKGLCPNAEKLYERIITIPLFPKMTLEDIDYVIRNLKEVVDINRAE